MKKASQKQQLAELQYRIDELEKSEEQHKETERALRISEAKFQGLLESAPDAIVLVDVRAVIVLVNAETETIFGYDRKELIGKSIAMLIPEHLRDLHTEHVEDYLSNPRIRPMGRDLNITAQRKDGSQLPVDIKLSPYETQDGQFVISIIRDITERRRIEEEREKLISELQNALEKVKTLSGMLPICASCKKIRDDEGYWKQIESYITEHLEAVFSHGICPECKEKLYPDL